MDACRFISKFGLIIINLLFWAAGAGLIFIGSILFVKYAKYGSGILSLGTALLPALIILVIGILTIVLGMIGCCAAFKDQKCGTGLFFTLLLIIFIGLITGTALSFVYSKDIDNDLREVMNNGLKDYLDRKNIRSEVDMVQSEFHCCGVDNYTDWVSTSWYHNQTDHSIKYPTSCCKNHTCHYSKEEEHDKNLYQEGCYVRLKYILKHHLVVIAACGAGFLLVLLLGMAFSCALLMSRRREANDVPYVGISSDPDGLRI